MFLTSGPNNGDGPIALCALSDEFRICPGLKKDRAVLATGSFMLIDAAVLTSHLYIAEPQRVASTTVPVIVLRDGQIERGRAHDSDRGL
jgi:hypothetical protein